MSFSNGLEKRPKLRFPGFDEPWNETAFEDLGNFYNGISGKDKNDFGKGDDRYITYMNVYKNVIADIHGCDVVRIKEGEHQNRVNFGDLLFTQSSETLDEVGLTSVWLHDYTPLLNSFCFGFHFDTPSLINPRFAAYSMRTPYARKRIAREGQGATRYNLSSNRLKKVKILYPSHSEQDIIAGLLSLLETRIERQCEIIDQLKKYKRGLISNILKQNLAVSHEGEKWEEVSLNDVADGFKYGMNAAATTFDGIHKYVRITDIDDDTHTYIDDDPVSPSGALEEKYRVRDNDILFARTGASVGKSYLYRKSDGELFFAGFLIRVHVKEGVDSEYVFLNTLTEEYDKWVLLESARSGQPGINAEQYRQYRFKLPSLRTQRKIAAIAQKLDARIQKESMCLHFFQEQKLGLLQQLFI